MDKDKALKAFSVNELREEIIKREAEIESNIDRAHGLNLLNIAVFCLSIFALATLLGNTFFPLSAQAERLMIMIDDAICVFFLIEFCIRLIQAKNKKHYLKWGWIDLLASIPSFTYFRWGRIIRLFRIIRIFKSTKLIINHIYRDRGKGVFGTVLIFTILVILCSSISILQVENVKESNIKTPEDAIWWACVTITTVGYGDKYPVTTAGHVIAIILMFVGVGLFGTFAGFVSSWFGKSN